MVHIKRIELSHFKSFGGTTKVPILPGFTVVSGPNGSGKSNILDGILFCLGLASSKGMRADRLPDLVNHKHNSNGKSAEAIVSVTFDLSDLEDLSEQKEIAIVESDSDLIKSEELEPDRASNGNNGEIIDKLTSEWTVTRRLKIGKGGNYSSTFYINGEVCTATELHEQLNRLRIYPEGYNVVLQGDVTRIISMSNKERREIIDELAGVAAFDRKIEQTKRTLEKVREREEHCHIIAQELINSRDRLAADRIKAEKYRKLKEKIQQQKLWEVVLVWQALQQQQQQFLAEINQGKIEINRLTEELQQLELKIAENTSKLEELNTSVKALGEEEQLAIASTLATQKAKHQQLQQREIELKTLIEQKQLATAKNQQELQNYQQDLAQLILVKNKLETETIPCLTSKCQQAKITLEQTRIEADRIAAASEAWVQEQADLTRQISTLQANLNPQRTEQATIIERQHQLVNKANEQTQLLQTTQTELAAKQNDFQDLSNHFQAAQENIKHLAQQLAITEHECTIQQDTQKRLLKEQRDKQRELDRNEATKQAQQEAQGTYATQIIINANLPGIHGLVAQLGQVSNNYQLALETAAGGRLGNIVVEDERVASEAIEFLKAQRAGRATFLPLNKIQAPRLLDTTSIRYSQGFVDLAVNLINCESRYQKIFAYVFGNTVVFDNLVHARYHLGKYRIVTLEGEILESSGAMTGGSQSSRSSLHFGALSTRESEEIVVLKQRLTEIASILSDNEQIIADLLIQVKNLGKELTEARQNGREKQLRLEQLQQEINRLEKQQEQLINSVETNQQEQENIQVRVQTLATNIPEQEIKLRRYQQRLDQLESSHNQSEWQQIQSLIKTQENELSHQEKILREAENQFKDADSQYKRLLEKSEAAQQHLVELEQEQIAINEESSNLSDRIIEIEQNILTSEGQLQQLNEQLGTTKQERDRVETSLRKLQNQQQQTSWKKEKLQTTIEEKNTTLQHLQQQLDEQTKELPDPIPEIPQLINTDEDTEVGEQITFNNLSEQLEQIQKQIRRGEKKLEAMEPVNMLALEEYEKTEARLQELSEKLNTIAAERSELLLRVEKFTTLRFRAFKEAFDAVNQNFQIIFAELSEGDGHLQLDDEEDPFNGGLNLVAHPKGKPVQRLSSMSGGEKSLTALSFIFSLQRYRPSPFYAFDEVDMFLDGANVARLSKMVKKQAQQAQFLVVSLRRPMIEASERTIGVTQARGAHTQVLGIKL